MNVEAERISIYFLGRERDYSLQRFWDAGLVSAGAALPVDLMRSFHLKLGLFMAFLFHSKTL